MKSIFAIAAGLTLTSMAAQAVTVTAADLLPYANGTTPTTIVNGVIFQALGGNFDSRTVAGYTSIGVDYGVPGEINRGEAIVAGWGLSQQVASFSVALLFNGPEFGDVNEVARVQLAGTDVYGKLTAVADTQATWQLFNASSDESLGAASFVSAVSPATQDGAGVWTVNNPFANYVGTGLSFSTLPGVCGAGNSCWDQSDYAFSALSTAAVPEPSSYAMFGVGLVAVAGLMLRRRSQSNRAN